MLRRSISSLRGKSDRLHALIVATRRGGVFISESDGCIAVRCVALIDWKAADVSADMSPVCYFWKTAKTSVLKLFVSHLFVYIVYNISVLCNGAGGKA